jgi:hypothetical protein
MTFRNIILAIPLLVLSLSFSANLLAQGDVKSDVYKEYDEDGNMTRFDSTWTWSYRSGPGCSLDSVFNRLFSDHWLDTGFHMGQFHLFGDSAWNFYHGFWFPDSNRILEPEFMFPDHFFRGFQHQLYKGFHKGFSDSLFSMPFRGPLFDGEEFQNFLKPFPFPDFGQIFRDHMDRMNDFFHHFPPDSSLYHQHWNRTLPEDQDKPPGGTE